MFWTVVLEMILGNPLDSNNIKPVNPKGNQSWIFIGRTDSEVPILWPPDVKSWLTGKDPDAEKDWEQEEKGMTEDKMVEWHQWLNRHEFEHVMVLVLDWEVWHLAVHGVAKSRTQLSNWTTVGWGQSLSQRRTQDDNYENVMNVRRSYLNTKHRLCNWIV